MDFLLWQLGHTNLILCFSDLPTHIFYFPKKKKKMAAWVSVTLKCCGQVLQARHVVQCARECSFASLLPKIDYKYEVPMFIIISKNESFEDSDHS